ncbi:hypothetical protein SynBMKMC1_00331 [Synechococcus sp. BMK-MC-1]|nr:hypothetical protein SynBMKMC1_00331 [Synechococcus sp. BMK-MC-1]
MHAFRLGDEADLRTGWSTAVMRVDLICRPASHCCAEQPW